MDENLEKRFEQLADERIENKKYKVFDKNSRLIKRHKFPEMVHSGKTMAETALVVLNAEGDAIILTEEFELELLRILKKRYS